MNIAVDIQPFFSDSKYRGIGVYVAGLLNNLFKLDKENYYFLFNMYGTTNTDEFFTIEENVQIDNFYMGKDSCLLSRMFVTMDEYEQRYEDLICALFQKYIKTNHIDVFFVTAPLDVWCSYKKEWFEGAKLTAIVYDLIPLLFYDRYLVGRGGRIYYKNAIDFLKNADKLMAISQSVKEDCIKYLEFEDQKIDIIYSGVDKSFFEKSFSEEQMQKTLQRFNITDEFFLFPSAPDPRKNLVQTLKAYNLLPKSVINQYKLVISGSMYFEYLQNTRTLIDEMGLSNRVVITDYISEDDLIILYRTAKLMLFPSLYEGFGLPIMEAFASGLPVVTSNNSSLVELAKDCAVIVDPYDTKSIADGIISALTEVDFSKFENEIKIKLDTYTWSNTATLALKTLNSLTVGPKPQEVQPSDRKCLAYFAPINRHDENNKNCLRLLKSFTRCFNVEVFVSDIDEAKDIASDKVLVRHCSEYNIYSMKYAETIYYLANRTENMYMLRYLRTFGGMMILEDYNLHHSVYEYFVRKINNWDEYKNMLSCEVENADELIKEMKESEVITARVLKELALNKCAVNYVKKIVVSNRKLRNELLMDDIGMNIKTIQFLSTQNNDDQISQQFYQFINTNQTPAITESLLGEIYKKEIATRGLGSEEMSKLSKTFSYILAEDGVKLAEPMEQEKQQNAYLEVNSKRIMEDIYKSLKREGINIPEV